MLYVSSILVVVYYFSKRRGLALGLLYIGSRIGNIITYFLPEINFRFHHFLWAMSACFFVTIFLTLLFEPFNKEESINGPVDLKLGQSNFKNFSEFWKEFSELLKNVLLYFFALALVFVLAAMFSNDLLNTRQQQLNTRQTIDFLLHQFSKMGGSILSGAIIDGQENKFLLPTILTSNYTLMIIIKNIFPLKNFQILSIIFSSVVGLLNGAISPLAIISMIDVCGLKQLEHVWGILLITHAVGYSTGPSVSSKST